MIEQRVTLRYDAQQIPAIVQAVQGDTGRDVIFELADYEIPAGATANYYIDKPDDTAIYNSAEVISSTEILAHLTEQALAAPGRNNGQVRILSDDEVITSFDFVLEVMAFRGILHMQSETEVNIFDQAIEDAVNTATEEAVAEIQAQTPVVTGVQNSIAPTYSPSSTYAVGDYVMYNAQLYKCNTAITTAEAWTAAHWTQVPIASDVSVLKNAINELIPLIDAQTIDVSSGETRGAFISDLGDIRNTSGTFAYSAPIAVYKNKKYSFTACGSTIIGALSTCDSSGNNRSVKEVYAATGTEETFEYTPTEDEYIVLSYNYDLSPYVLEVHDTNLNSVRYYANEIEKISEYNENLVDFSNVVLGKNWALADASDRAILNFDVNPLTEYVFRFPNNSNFWAISAVEKTSPTSTSAIKSTGVPNGGTLNLKTQANTTCICVQFAASQAVTELMFQEYDAVVTEGSYEMTAIDYVLRNERFWNGKRLVWLGTSIPAAGRYNVNNKTSYPLMVGQRLGATVYNEAVGSSALHCKDPNRINANNPYGFMANFEAVSRCITNSLDEMDWIIAHYNDTNVFTQNVPTSLTDADKEFIRSCSWEIKLQKYFTSEDFPDAWIMDHGHNDIPSEYSEATYTAKTVMAGSQHDGYYNGGDFVPSTASSYLEYDVSDEFYVWISGDFGSYYDRYDLYDADGNNIGWFAEPTITTITDMEVNCVGATTLRVSNVNTHINTISVKKLTYPMYNSLYSYQGGFDFIVNKIKEYNPRARIIMIGEYENQKYPTISENQIIASERWEFPLYRQWENLGWSQQYVKVDGEYITYLNYFIPDNLHPHSDTTGWALEQMANNISAWLKTIS